jgi:hypothetical protein
VINGCLAGFDECFGGGMSLGEIQFGSE